MVHPSPARSLADMRGRGQRRSPVSLNRTFVNCAAFSFVECPRSGIADKRTLDRATSAWHYSAMNNAIKAAHAHSANHRSELAASQHCGCFYCCSVFLPTEIEDWCDEGRTALCPHCGIDSVIGDASNFQVTKPEFLKEMNRYWF